MTVTYKYGKLATSMLEPGQCIDQLLGQGQYGCVYTIKHIKSISGPNINHNSMISPSPVNLDDVVIKYQTKTETNDPDQELQLQLEFAQYGLAPKVYNYGCFINVIHQQGKRRRLEMNNYSSGSTFQSESKVWWIMMQRVETTLEQWLKNSQRDMTWQHHMTPLLFKTLEAMRNHHLIHGDLHLGNLGITHDQQLILLDCGLSSHDNGQTRTDMEMLNIIHTLNTHKKHLRNNKPMREIVNGWIIDIKTQLVKMYPHLYTTVRQLTSKLVQSELQRHRVDYLAKWNFTSQDKLV
jgi:tRNA A-37 threonylcarbamoyl transferase component Bud32